MVEMAVGVHDDRHRVASQLPDVVLDLARLDVRRARIDDERLAAAEHQPDVLVVERVPPHEESVAELDPAVIHTHGRHGSHTGRTSTR